MDTALMRHLLLHSYLLISFKNMVMAQYSFILILFLIDFELMLEALCLNKPMRASSVPIIPFSSALSYFPRARIDIHILPFMNSLSNFPYLLC